MSDAATARPSGIDPETGTWAPAFPGQRKPFAKGHTFSMVSGVNSERVVAPIADEIAAKVLSDRYWPWLAHPLMAGLVRDYARALARLRLLEEHLEEIGWPFDTDDDEDEQEPPRRVSLWQRRMAAYNAWNRAYRRWLALESKLGRFPAAEATAPKDALWRLAQAAWLEEQRERRRSG